ncbi:MAG TPA: decarboxylase [Candidatus Omnitrophica bacterium]|nr:decarboxylase [Candidatus Omnitrophota bacterium]
MNVKQQLDRAREILKNETPLMSREMLEGFVAGFLNERKKFLSIVEENGSPLYVFDENALIRKARQMRDAFIKEIPSAKFFYALKSNNSSFIIQTLLKEGFGIDVSSGKELNQALSLGTNSLIFSGPGKTYDEHMLCTRQADKVTVLLDSFGELSRLDEVASKAGVRIRAGVRLMIEENGLWRKFGIPLKEVPRFFEEAKKKKNVDVCGLQFHSSWNLNAGKQVAFLSRIAKMLSRMDKNILKKIKFLDIGGGYWPQQGEWMQPGSTPEGKLKQCLDPQLTEGMDHRYLPSITIEEFSKKLSKALEKYIFKYLDCDICIEPGRWLSHEAMHILLKVIDKKDKDVVITDGGTNSIGWERFEMDYFPVINLSSPALKENPCMVFGSLCTPHDLWGYSYFGKSIEEGDILLIPTQGAYTYSLRQEFIKPLPKEVHFT